ncbi:MAG TPA: sodium:solute symporter family protein [Longimicrobiales bacterium]
MTTALYFVLLYMLLQLGIGVWISRRIRSEADYLIAGRSLGYTLATFSIFATWFGAETVVGSAGNAYRDGVSLGSAEPFGYGLCLILMGVIFAIPLWRRRLTTLADLFRSRYSVTVERVAAIILVPSSILWAAAQVRAFGQIISTASAGWNVDLAIGIAAVFTIAYTMFGGLLVDAITDVIQGLLVMIGLTGLFVLVVLKAGGLAAFGGALEQSPGINWLPQGEMSALAIAEEWAIPIMGSVVATELVGRIIATRTPQVARNSSLLAGGLYLMVGLLPLLIGLAATGLGVHIADAEQVVPMMAREMLPTIAYAAFVGAIISAILSTVDSTLLTAAGLLSHNLIVPMARVTSERTKVLIARAGVLLFGVMAYTLALTAEGVYALVEQASALGSSGALVVICFGLFTSFGGARAALTALLAGTLAYLAFAAAGTTAPFLFSLACALVSYLLIGAVETRHVAQRSVQSAAS